MSDLRIKKIMKDTDEYNYLNRKYHSLSNAFEQTRQEINNLYNNSDLMTNDQFHRLYRLEKEYRSKFLAIVKEMAENE